MMAVRQDLHINQGETWSFSYPWENAGSPVDLTDYSARMSIRDRIGGSLYAYLSTGGDADGGTITLGGVTGVVALSMTAEETTALYDPVDLEELKKHRREPEKRTVKWLYDLELESAGGVVTRLLHGRILLQREVTE
ncbi:MAG: hypothetical protein MI753_09375 [Hyphomicrobiales bacterium]|nr:hypothetical protein [Hyphomicrobiales bacterium]